MNENNDKCRLQEFQPSIVDSEQPSHKEAVQRFCPVYKKNVVMLRHYESLGERFECISGSCKGSPDCRIKD